MERIPTAQHGMTLFNWITAAAKLAPRCQSCYRESPNYATGCVATWRCFCPTKSSPMPGNNFQAWNPSLRQNFGATLSRLFDEVMQVFCSWPKYTGVSSLGCNHWASIILTTKPYMTEWSRGSQGQCNATCLV